MSSRYRAKHVLFVRVAAAVPLIAIGSMHLTGQAPLRPILEGAGIPFVGFNAEIAPIVEIVAGVSLLLGAFVQLGTVLATVAMLAAFYAHLNFDWADEPPVALPLLVLAAALYVLWRGAGAFSVDAARHRDAERDRRSGPSLRRRP